MHKASKFATAAAIAVAGLGVTTASASAAYSISGGNYTGTGSGHSFTIDSGNGVVSCTSATFTGNANGSATTSFQPAYSGCTTTISGIPFNASVAVAGPWSITVNSGSGPYSGTVSLPSGSGAAVTVTDPSDPSFTCHINVAAPQGPFSGGSASNSGSGVNLSATVSGVNWTVPSGDDCAPLFSGTSGSDGTYNTNGNVSIPGVTVAGP